MVGNIQHSPALTKAGINQLFSSVGKSSKKVFIYKIVGRKLRQELVSNLGVLRLLGYSDVEVKGK